MKSFNNSVLVIIFLGFLGLYILERIFHSAKMDRNAAGVALFEIDTAAVNEVDIYPNKNGGEIRLFRSNEGWQIEQGPYKATPEKGFVVGMLGFLVHPVVERTVSDITSEWDEYDVGYATGTRVVVKKGNETTADFWIGNEDGYEGESFLRMQGHNEVYAVAWHMSPLFDKTFSDLREK